MKTILKVLVGSQAHGLAGPDSDQDYRGVFVLPTSEILSLGGTTRFTSWKEGDVDDMSWEVGHFLWLATKSNPSILEAFLAPVQEATPWGVELRSLFPLVWTSRGVYDAFRGYGLNQRKKFLDERGDRRNKYAVAYLRTLFNAWQLLHTGTFSVNIVGTPIEQLCRKFRAGDYTIGEVVDTCRSWEDLVEVAYQQNPNKETDVAVVNDFLLRLRKECW